MQFTFYNTFIQGDDFMKKMMISLLTLLIFASQAVVISANAEESQPVYNYNELAGMTDEQISELYDLSEYWFGDDSVPDEDKYSAYLNKVPDSYIGDNYESVSYGAYKRFVSGECIPYIAFSVDRYTKLNATINAESFGYPADWELTAYDGVFNIETGVPRQYHEYRIYVPLSVSSDFEKYIRLEQSFNSFKNNNYYIKNEYGVTGFKDIYHQFVSYGEMISNLYGDSNCDYNVDLADAIFIMQSLANPDRYTLTPQGRENADMNGNGVSAEDAFIIQEILLGLR